MEIPPSGRRMPTVPADLKYVELRLPGSFRELCANSNYSNEQIGRIVRCVALGNDGLLTPEIEPEVYHYRQDQENRLRQKLRKAKSRHKVQGDAKATASGYVRASDAESVFPRTAPSGVSDSPPAAAHEPERAPAPPPKVQTPPPRTKRSKAEKARDDLSDDLFAGVGGFSGRPCERTRASEAAAEPSNPSVDTRNDAAWIPGRFDQFWKEYPRKVAKSDAVKAFTKLIKSQQDVDRFMATTMASLAYWKTQDQWTKDKGKFIPYPATWLNAGHWNDCSENQAVPTQATFLQADAESDEDLVKRMTGG